MGYRSAVRSSEWIACLYFLYVAICAWIRRLPAGRRLALTAICLAAAGAVWWNGHAVSPILRDWSPLATILLGYYVSGALFVEPSLATEAWLMAWDRRLLGDPSTRFAAWPRPLVGFLEVIYMGCFVLIGLGFVILWLAGQAALADRYWTMVVGAELGAFAPLAFIQTRPPWALERKPVLADPVIHDVSLRMNRYFTIHVNTFPSGHVAGSLAVALAVLTAMPLAGTILLLFSLAITLGCIVGRYHYVIDAVTGALLAIAIAAATMTALG